MNFNKSKQYHDESYSIVTAQIYGRIHCKSASETPCNRHQFVWEKKMRGTKKNPQRGGKNVNLYDKKGNERIE